MVSPAGLLFPSADVRLVAVWYRCRRRLHLQPRRHLEPHGRGLHSGWWEKGHTSGQSFKQFAIVNYDSRVVPDLKTPHITILGS